VKPRHDCIVNHRVIWARKDSRRQPAPPAPALRALDRGGSGAQRGAPGRSPDASTTDGLGGGLRCRVCGHLITSGAARIHVAGAHAHERMNPAGIAFVIGCFREAPGCVVVGPASTDFTWFPPYAWRVALCSACLGHLGWAFVGADPSFFGLILERLTPDAPPRGPG
jgi:hypothetical protein